MNQASDNQAALDRFRQWLEQARIEADSLPAGGDLAAELPAAGAVGFLPFVEEFTALRHEVKLQHQELRGLIERAEASLAAMREAVDAFRGVEAKEARSRPPRRPAGGPFAHGARRGPPPRPGGDRGRAAAASLEDLGRRNPPSSSTS